MTGHFEQLGKKKVSLHHWEVLGVYELVKSEKSTCMF